MAGTTAQPPPATALPGEFEVIRRYFAPLAKGMPGALNLTDDACTWQPAAGEELVLTADALVADVHFLSSDPAASIARKMLRVNLSDLAAKGAKPAGYLMTLALDVSVDEAWLQEFARGLAEDQQLFDIHLMGGDTVKTPGPLTLSLTAIGTVPRGTALRRQGARPGDRIFTTGTIGDGHLGLQVLRHRFLELGHDHQQFLADRYHLPEPRLEFGQALCRRHLASAGLDISDGLVADLSHLATASNCGAILHSHAVPLSSAAAELVAQEPALMMALITGGDDYEILFTAAADKASEIQALAHSCHCRVTEIGECIEGEGVQVVDRDGQAIILAQTGYSHF